MRGVKHSPLGMSRRGFVGLAGVSYLSGCGGGGSDTPKPETISIPDFTLSSSTDRMVLTTNANGHNVGAGTFQLEFDVISKGYWSALPQSHFAVITRCDLSKTTEIWGAGMAVGTIYPKQWGAGAKALLETWRTLSDSDRNILYTDTLSPALPDWEKLSFNVASVVGISDQRYLRYSVKQGDQTLANTGLQVDQNTQYDPTKTAFVIGDAFHPVGDWKLEFSNVRYTWS